MKQAKKSRNLCYKQEMLGKTALVILHFTPMGKKLSSIQINIENAGKAHQKDVILALSEKHGAPLKYSPEKGVSFMIPDIRLQNAVSNTQFFAPDKQNLISVQYIETRKISLTINYNNISLSKQEQTEDETFQHYFKTRYRQQDENRM